jgi:hypothetical protein
MTTTLALDGTVVLAQPARPSKPTAAVDCKKERRLKPDSDAEWEEA